MNLLKYFCRSHLLNRMESLMKNIAIFASGEGTNAQNIIDYFKTSDGARVVLVVSNNSKANVLKRASDAGIKTIIVNREAFYDNLTTLNLLKSEAVDLIVLAGFLWRVPENLVNAFPNKIVNIHPSLLPKFGGQGMYGMNVHKAVIAANEKESGITIHYVNELYDKGQIIAQYKCTLVAADTAEDLAKKIHQLEMEFFPKTIMRIIG